MRYPEVKRSQHVVPRGYLVNFAEEEMLVMHLVGAPKTELVSIDDAAVRRRFYWRTRRDGTPIDDVEWSLSQLENATGRRSLVALRNWFHACATPTRPGASPPDRGTSLLKSIRSAYNS